MPGAGDPGGIGQAIIASYIIPDDFEPNRAYLGPDATPVCLSL